MSSGLKMHAKTKISNVIKFLSFVNKNNDVQFVVKRVFDAALMSTTVSRS